MTSLILHHQDVAAALPIDVPVSIDSAQTGNRGYCQRIYLRHGLNLLIRDYRLRQVLIEEYHNGPLQAELEFGFDLTEQPTEAGFLQVGFTPEEAVAYREWPPGTRILKIDLHLTPLEGTFSEAQRALIPPPLESYLEGQEPQHFPLGNTTPAVRWGLQQILTCPYHGWTRQLYLEGKVLELIALQTHQWMQAPVGSALPRCLKPAQVDQIHEAAHLLEQHLEAPPSLLQLARWVGLNDCTLKRGFRQVFGTTVFGYLRQRRLEQARQLLLEQQLSVTEAATAVGYTHVGHFAAAFKRAFGVSPRQLRQ